MVRASCRPDGSDPDLCNNHAEITLLLDTRNRVISIPTVYIGSLNAKERGPGFR